VAVHDLATALLAIDEIEEQGEGLKHRQVWDGDRDMFHPERDEVAHYFRFSEIAQGRSYVRGDSPSSGPSGAHFDVDWSGVYPMRPNPKMDDYPDDSAVRVAMAQFNVHYFDMLRTLHRALNGDPPSLSSAISMMMDLRTMASELMQMPTGDGATTAGPSFEFVASVLAPSAADVTIRVSKNGPYVVEGATLVRKSIVQSDAEESLTWKKGAVLVTEGEYRLCRCGQSSHKPFCDGTHARVDFDGTETATSEPSEVRRVTREGSDLTLSDDTSLCARAGFCHDHVEDVWAMVERTDDAQVRAKLMHMVEQCPSGRLIYELGGEPIEPDLPREIAVTKDGPYWVSGELTIELSGGQLLETRNRVTLCRCGQSKNKPLCDGTHKKSGFVEG
jgi:CDGSH-type Zn-finger protein